MSEHNVGVAETAGQEFVISRTFDAPLELVWKAHTEVEHLKQWWGPQGFTMLSCTLELRPGGRFHYGMQSPDGAEMWGKFEFREIVPQEKLVYTNSFSDKDGSTVRAPFSDNWPLEVLNTLTFSEQDGKTTLTLRGAPINANEEEWKMFAGMHDSMRQGFGGTLDQLEQHLSKMQS